ncbi:MAG TPA: signal peptidase II [Rectinemataceae bacterium]|nr:signal peptidase II [Rectinemataceae bacterium]
MSKDHAPLAPLALALAVVVLDQVSKALVVAFVPLGVIGWRAFGDFFWLIHASNLAAAFSVGADISFPLRWPLFSVRVILVVAVLVIYFRSRSLTSLTRWALMGIVGGGIGNAIDLAFRREGVVDFLSVKFYGLLGMERWPTFNVADATVVVCVILLAAALIVSDLRRTS